MILHHWQGDVPNFGDDLNTVLWPALLPDFFDDDPAIRFLGIGSILDARHPADPVKLVAGAGYGGYERQPLLDDRWVIHWVRGPLTARALNLPVSLGLGDPAMLLPVALPGLVPAPESAPLAGPVGFVPHFESLNRAPWRQVAALAGVELIDPRNTPEQVIAAMARCRLVLSESLHGVIVADTLRVPWIALRPLHAVHRAKWFDWAASVGVRLRPETLASCSLSERLGASRLARRHRLRRLLTRHAGLLDRLCPDHFLHRAADGLRRAAAAPPNLSDASALQRAQARMLDATARLQRDPLRPAACLDNARLVASGLLHRDNSEYQLRPVG